jgi:hypothetical protein
MSTPRIEINVYHVGLPQGGRNCPVECESFSGLSRLETLKSAVASLNKIIASIEAACPQNSKESAPPSIRDNSDVSPQNKNQMKNDDDSSINPTRRSLDKPESNSGNRLASTRIDSLQDKSPLLKVDGLATFPGQEQNSEVLPQFLPLRNFKKLYSLLIKFCHGKQIAATDIDGLSAWELEILKLILQRKYGSAETIALSRDGGGSGLLETITEHQSRVPLKRPEEHYKYVLTRAIKSLKKIFKINSDPRLEFEDMQISFYNHYFKNIALTKKLSIESFIYPLNSTNKSGKLKSLSLEYFRLVLLSKSFVSDLNQYMEVLVPTEHKEEAARKILNVLSRWDSRIEGVELATPQGDRLFAEVSRYFLKNKRCKLPWSSAELKHSIAKIKDMICKFGFENTRPL